MRKPRDVVVGLLFLGVSGAIYYVARGYPVATVAEGLGPRLVPLLLAGALGALSLVLALMGFFAGDADSRGIDGVSGVETWQPVFGRHLLVPALVVVLLALYLFFLNSLGFLIATPIFLAVTMLMLRSSLKEAAMVAVSFTVVVYLIFDLALSVPLPQIPFLGW